MKKEPVSSLLENLADAILVALKDNSKNFKIVRGNYLSEEEHPQIIGEFLTVVSSVGLARFATANFVYSTNEGRENIIYLFGEKEYFEKIFKTVLSEDKIDYRVVREDV